MAFEADCGVSMVLEDFRVASTSGFLVPGECWAARWQTVCGRLAGTWVGGSRGP